MSGPVERPKKVLVKVQMDRELLASLDELCARYGDSRAHMIRRLIVDASGDRLGKRY